MRSQVGPETRGILSSFRLKAKLMVFITIVLCVGAGLTFMVVSQIFRHLETSVRADLGWKAVRGAEEISQAADVGIALRDEAIIRTAFDKYRNSADVLAIVATDATGKVLARHGSAPADIRTLFSVPPGEINVASGHFWSWSPSTIDGNHVGRIALAISGKRLAQGAEMRQRILLVAGGVSAVALVLSLFFVNSYLGPVLRLTEDSLLAVQDLNATLEERIAERTKALRQTAE